MQVAERNPVRRQGSACIGTSLPSSADLTGETPDPRSSSPASLYIPPSLLLARSRVVVCNAVSCHAEVVWMDSSPCSLLAPETVGLDDESIAPSAIVYRPCLLPPSTLMRTSGSICSVLRSYSGPWTSCVMAV